MKKRLPSIRSRLMLLVVACVFPAAVMAFGLIFFFYERDATQSRATTIATARALTAALDQHVIGVQASLSMLASSELLQHNDLKGFYERSRHVQINHHEPPIVLVGLDGQQLLNTSVPFGTPLPKNAVPQIIAAARVGQPGFSDLRTGQALNQPLLVVGVPVMKAGTVTHALTAPIAPAQLRDLLIRQNLPQAWVAAIVDGQGKVVARTVAHEKFLGAAVEPRLYAHMREANEDSVNSTTLDGIPVFSAFSHSPLSNWAVVIGVPKTELYGRLQHSLLLLLGGTGLLLGLSLLLAWYFAERITRTVHTLTQQAAALGHGQAQTPEHVDFREARQLSEAFEQAAEKLRHSNSELVQRNLDLQQFAFVASHDLRAPLSSVSGFLGLLLRRHGQSLDQKAIELIERAGNAVRQMDNLTTDLLTYARLDSSNHPRVAVDCNEVLASTLSFLDATIQESGVQLEVNPLPTVLGDRGELIQLFQNLLGNALKYRAKATPHIRVSAQQEAGFWVFSVADNGIGIEPQHQQRIFEVFKRLHTTQDYPGSGMGLAICQRIAEKHGGKIWVESAPDEGSTFKFSLPATP